MDTGGKTENSGRNAEKGKAKSVGTPSSVSSKEKKPGYPWLEVPAKRISVRGSNPANGYTGWAAESSSLGSGCNGEPGSRAGIGGRGDGGRGSENLSLPPTGMSHR